jgi:hypothetical protein
MTQRLKIKASYAFNSMGTTDVEAFYDFVNLTAQGRYLFEHAVLLESGSTEMDVGLRQELIMTWVFHREEAETFYVLKWTD